jgi:hypothetical protein
MKSLQVALMALSTIAFIIAVMSSPIQDDGSGVTAPATRTRRKKPVLVGSSGGTAPEKRTRKKKKELMCTLDGDECKPSSVSATECLDWGDCAIVDGDCRFKLGSGEVLGVGILPSKSCKNCHCKNLKLARGG